MTHPAFAFLINPGSGSVTPARIKQLHDAIKAQQLDAEVILAGADIEDQARRLRAAGYQAVIAAGGDGTLRAVADALAGTDTAFGILPWGTFNHFAKDLGITGDLDEILAGLKDGQTRRIDTGSVNGETYLNHAGIGVYAQFVVDREKVQPKLGKPLAAVLACIQMFITYRTYRLHLVVDGQPHDLVTPLVLISNNAYQIERLGLPHAETDDKLRVYTLKSDKRWDVVKLSWRTVFGNPNSDLFDAWTPTELKIDARTRSLLVSLDGEVERMKLPLDIKLEKRSLKLINTATEK